MPPLLTPRRLSLETAAAAAGALLVALLLLGAGSLWRSGLVGEQDAWQTLWNLHHVDRALVTGGPLFFSKMVWAPEGAFLRAHTLSPTNTVPGALLARLVGFPLAYNLLVVFAFVLAAAGSYRLARRLSLGVAGSASGALAFAFAPPHFVRASSHLNLLGTGWIPLALEGLLVASRGETLPRRIRGLLLGAGSLVALVFTDWSLGLLGALAAASFSAFEIGRTPRGRRRQTAVTLSLAGLLALSPVLPAARALFREARGGSTGGHDPRVFCTAVTSLFVPSREQRIARLLGSWPDRSRQSVLEGTAYLGLVPLALTLWVSFGAGRRRDLDFALVAGGIALLLSLGPMLRLFDTFVPLPLPYALLERLLPAFRLGGCPNRFLLLALLPLSLGTAAGVDRLMDGGRPGRKLGGLALLLLAVEYAPVRPGFFVWPEDRAMEALAASPLPGNVLDVDPGAAALARQLVHGRPQVFGYLSKVPAHSREIRLEDPVLGPLLEPSRPRTALPRPAAAALLRDVWKVSFVVAPDVSPYRERGAALGFDLFSREPGLSFVWRIPDEAPTPVTRIDFGEEEATLLERGIVERSFYGGETLLLGGEKVRGRWTGPEASCLAPIPPGRWSLVVAAPRPDPPHLTVSFRQAAQATVVDGIKAIPVDVAPADSFPDGMVLLRLSATPYAARDGRALGVFAIALEPAR